MGVYFVLFFFFSSRRRHTRSYGDWSSDVCSSDLRFVHGEGAACGMQLAHSGRKGSTLRPWEGLGALPPGAGAWQPVGPTAEPFADNYPVPRPMTAGDVASVVDAFRQAARRALAAGFDVIEIHAAHGYLIHEFLSPVSNTRTDEYGGTFE